MQKIITLFLSVMLCFFSATAQAKHKPKTISEYIRANCTKSCVDHKKLIKATKAAKKKYNVDPKLMIALIKVESRFSKTAKSGRHHPNVGLTQVSLAYHRDKFPKGNYYDTDANIMAGADIFSDCMSTYKKNLRRSLTCYNGNGDPNYASKVISSYHDVGRLTGFNS